MGLPKGRSNNYKGRAKGTPNKVTRELRQIINDILNDKLENIDELYKHASPGEKIKILTELLPYCLPKLNSINEKTEQLRNGKGIVQSITDILTVRSKSL